MRTGTKVFLGTSLGFTAGVALTILFERLYAADGFLKNSLESALAPPITPTKVLIVVAALLTFVALPFSILEWRSERRFLRTEREMREARPADVVTPYVGPEGRGSLFEGPAGRVLLLEPLGGMGLPRLVELASPAEEASTAPPEGMTLL